MEKSFTSGGAFSAHIDIEVSRISVTQILDWGNGAGNAHETHEKTLKTFN